MTEDLKKPPMPPPAEEHHYAKDALHMHKGEEVVLTADAPTMKKIFVGLGWEAPPQSEGFDIDIDASAFLLTHSGRVRRDTDFVFYNNLQTEKGIIRHDGDSTRGEAEGDDEVIHIELDRVPFDVDRIAFAVTIHNAKERQQTFGLIRGAYIRIVNEDENKELAHFDLTEDADRDNAMVFGELVRDGTGWAFKALGLGTDGGLFKIARDYGVNVAPL